MLQRLGSASLSGVAGLGNILDLPGSSIRDLLALKNPLDQWLPWMWARSEGRTSGRDLARQFGLAGKEDTYGNWWGGLAVELLTDPLTYTGIGALTKAGKATQAAGALADVARVSGKGGFSGALKKIGRAHV